MSVTDYLSSKIDAGTLRSDAAQMDAARALDDLAQRLKGYSPKRSLFSGRKEPPKGLYIWGGVGRGKSMLMDVFYNNLPQTRKSRVHFHAFMQDVHARIYAWRKMDDKARRANASYVRGAGDDPIAPTAKAIAAQADILCFDEFHVTDITDAMILSRLFTALFARGVVVVATSNRAPDNLYKDGLNRALFLPFIELMKQKLEIFDFDGDEDHRLRKLQKAPVYWTPLDKAAAAGLEAAWQDLTKLSPPKMMDIHIKGRTLSILASHDTARARFADLCARALGAADYLELAQTFTTLILEDVPVMGADLRDQAKRFVTLIDALYETKTKLILSAETTPEKLYQDGDGSFEFERTVSRLMEMQSAAYLGQAHCLVQMKNSATV